MSKYKILEYYDQKYRNQFIIIILFSFYQNVKLLVVRT